MVLLNEYTSRNKVFLSLLGAISLVSFVIILIAYSIDIDTEGLNQDQKKTIKLLTKIIITSIILLLISIFMPSKETSIEMMIASQVTHENVITTKEEIYEVVDYITDKVKEEKKR